MKSTEQYDPVKSKQMELEEQGVKFRLLQAPMRLIFFTLATKF